MDAEKGSFGRAAALLVPVLTGLGASAVLVVDYVRPTPVFCDAESGCAALKETIFASFLGVPTPFYGVLAFILLGTMALQRGPTVRNAAVAIAGFGALVAAALLSIQALFGVWCKFCIVADSSALLAFAFALWRKVGEWDLPGAVPRRLVLASPMVVALGVPIAYGALKKPVVPDAIAREIAQTPHGEVTVVDFADFECPYCRKAHAILQPLLASHQSQVRVVRKNVPLTRMHPHALDAARAACCGDAMGKGEAMADALFSAPVDDLTPDGCAKLATSLGLDEGAFRKCTSDPATDARIQEDQATFKSSHGQGLPTLWIDDQKIEGYRPDDTVQKTLEREIGKRG